MFGILGNISENKTENKILDFELSQWLRWHICDSSGFI